MDIYDEGVPTETYLLVFFCRNLLMSRCWCFIGVFNHLTVRYGFRASHEAFDLSALDGPGTWDLAAGPSPTAVVHRADGKVLIRNVSFPAPREQAAMGLQQIGVIFPLEP